MGSGRRTDQRKWGYCSWKQSERFKSKRKYNKSAGCSDPAEILWEQINKIRVAITKYKLNNGYDPSVEELADILGYTVERVQELNKYLTDTVSLNTRIGEEDDTELASFIADEEDIEETVTDSLLRDKIEEVLDELSPKEKNVLELRFGLKDGRVRTLEEVGREYNVTRERIRQIEAKALKKLRQPNRIRKLEGFI